MFMALPSARMPSFDADKIGTGYIIAETLVRVVLSHAPMTDETQKDIGDVMDR